MKAHHCCQTVSVRLLSEKLEHGVRAHFKEALAKKTFDPNDVAAGRAFVKAYVEYIHYVEGIYQATTSAAHGHYPEGEKAAVPEHIHTEEHWLSRRMKKSWLMSIEKQTPLCQSGGKRPGLTE